jgi:internalin A
MTNSCQKTTQVLNNIFSKKEELDLALENIRLLDSLEIKKQIEEYFSHTLVKIEDGRKAFFSEARAMKHILDSLMNNFSTDDRGELLERFEVEEGHIVSNGYGSGPIDNLDDYSKLEYLRELYIKGFSRKSQVLNIGGLKLLEVLDVQKTTITEIIGLENTLKLEDIGIADSMVRHLPDLSKHINLINLDAGFNNLDSLEFLRNHPSLEVVRLSHTRAKTGVPQIQDASVLGTIESLKSLHIFQMPVGDLSFVSKLKKLTSLSFDLALVTQLDFIENMTSLDHLQISHSLIADFTPISTLTNLSKLEIIGNAFSDLKIILPLKKLKILRLDSLFIGDLSPLLELEGLEQLAVNYIRLDSFGQEVLRKLRAKGVRVTYQE